MSDVEEDEKVQALVKQLREQYSINLTLETLGNIELRQLSLKEFSTVRSFSKEALDDKDFALKLIFSLIVEPKFSLDVFQEIPDSELISIIRKICDKNETLKKFFSEPEDNRVFTDFREAVKEYNNEKANEISKAIRDIGLPTHQILCDALQKNAISKIDFPQIASQIVIPQMNVIQTWAKSIEEIFDNIVQQYSELAKSLEKYDLTIESADRILKKYKWFISLSLPASFYGKVLEIEESGVSKRKRINALFVDYFSKDSYENLEELVEGWKSHPQFKPRMKIFRNCVTTLKRAKRGDNPSILVIPALIAQIDGIQNEIVAKYNVTLDPATKMWVDGKGNQSQTKKETERKLITSLNEYSPIGEYLLLEILFQEAWPGKDIRIPTTFCRHKILHGEYINYGRKDNAIRAFLILDFLNYLEGI